MPNQIRHRVFMRSLIFIFQDDKVLLMKYSGRGAHQTKEKANRKNIYNGIGGHVEAGEDIIAHSERESMEEAGIRLKNPKLKGFINVSGFANHGDGVALFIIVSETDDEPLASTLEGELHWAPLAKVHELNTFADVLPILKGLRALRPGQSLVGTSRFQGFELIELNLRAV